MRGEDVGDALGVVAVALHAHRERLEAALGEEAVERAGHRAHPVLSERAARQLVVVGDERAADDVGVPTEVLRRGVHDDVRAQRERRLQVGRGEGVVDDQRGSCSRDVRERRDVGDAEQRVGRRLAPEDLGVRPHRRAHGVDVGRVDRGVLDAPGARTVESAGRCRRRRRAG